MENKTNFEWAEMFQEQIQNGASQSDIVQMLEEYNNQALRIHNVVGRSGLLPDFYCSNRAMGGLKAKCKEQCEGCGKPNY